jgi:hypothetical protein
MGAWLFNLKLKEYLLLFPDDQKPKLEILLNNNLLITLKSVTDAQSGLALTTGGMTFYIWCVGSSSACAMTYNGTTSLWQGVMLITSFPSTIVAGQWIECSVQYEATGYLGTWNGTALVKLRGTR